MQTNKIQIMDDMMRNLQRGDGISNLRALQQMRQMKQPQPQTMTYMAKGGFPENAPRAQGMLNGPGTGTSDSIPAYLSNGEFVVTAKAVKNAGGAKPMYEMMDYLEKGGKLSPQSRGNA